MRYLLHCLLSFALTLSVFADEVTALSAFGSHRFFSFTIAVEKIAATESRVTVFDQNQRLLSRRTFGASETLSVGGHSGLFMPQHQPLPSAFLITKHGGYDGRTLLINKEGKIIDLPGGSYAYEPKSKRFFSKHESDLPPLITVIEETLELAAAGYPATLLLDRSKKPIILPTHFTHLAELAEKGSHSKQRR